MIINNSFNSSSASTNSREPKNVIGTLLSYGPKVKNDAHCIKLYEIVTKKDRIDALFLLSKEELRRLHL